MLSAIPIKQLVIQSALMAGDGFIAGRDTNTQVKSNAAATPPVTTPTSPPLRKSWAVRYQGAALLAGVVCEFAGVDADISESLILASTTLIARELTIRGLQGKTGVQAQGMRAQVHRSHARANLAPPMAGGTASMTGSTQAVVGIAG